MQLIYSRESLFNPNNELIDRL